MPSFKHLTIMGLFVSCLLSTGSFATNTANATEDAVHLGPRPLYLINDMDDGALKEKLLQCQNNTFSSSDFSIGHRGAALQFPEHTRESYLAAAQMGAGIIECDATFTKDKALVCRHSQCDLHATTNILTKPDLAAKCTTPFVAADPDTGAKASAKCCTSDITLAEFKTLKGKMDGVNVKATNIEEYLKGTASWRTDMYASTGTLMTHSESIELIDTLGRKFTPELKSAEVPMPYEDDYSQRDYAQALIDDYKIANISPDRVFPQSFNLEDVLYWIKNEPEFGAQAVFLDSGSLNPSDPSSFSPSMAELADQGVKYIAPPMWMLLDMDENRKIVPSIYAQEAKAAGLNIITWTLERSGPLATGGGWYYKTIKDAINNDGDMMVALDVLAQDVGVKGVFSDWPATTTYYANCMGLR